MVKTFQDLAESSLANLLDNLKTESNLIILRDPVVSIRVVIAIVYYSLSFSRMDFVFI